MDTSSETTPISTNNTNMTSSIETATTKDRKDEITTLAQSVLKHSKLLKSYGEDIIRLESVTLQELVSELQIKLDELEERSIRRTQNILLSNDEDVINWLPNPDPEMPEPGENLRTVKEFRSVGKRELVEVMGIYGLVNDAGVPSDEEFRILWDEFRTFLGLPRITQLPPASAT